MPSLAQWAEEIGSMDTYYSSRMNHEIDHKAYPARLRRLPAISLRFIIRDAKEALAAMPDSPKAGYYADEINYAAMELQRRKEA